MISKSLQEIRAARGIQDTAELDDAYEEAQRKLPLAALRKASGVTQTEMAARLGVTQAAVSKFEGRGDFLYSTLYRYAKTLGAKIDVRITAADKSFELQPHEDEGDFYFSLEARKTSADLLKIREAQKIRCLVLTSHEQLGRQSKTQADYSWAAYTTASHSSDITHALMHMAKKNERKSRQA